MRITPTVARVLGGLLEAKKPISGSDFINDYGLFSGTLYPILRRLEVAGWVTSFWEDGEPTELGRPNRRFYQLSAVGQREAEKALKSERIRKFFWAGIGEPQGA
jgi:PadR family transcriptional regulator, regulatory protein PadR